MRDEDALQMPILGEALDTPIRSRATDWASFPTSRNYVTGHVRSFYYILYGIYSVCI